MVEEATQKQISFAQSLGIENPENFTKEALKELISKKLDEKSGNPKKTQQGASVGVIAATQGIGEVKHIFQSSYEVGAAGNRHTIKYFTIPELKEKLEALKNAGLYIDVA